MKNQPLIYGSLLAVAIVAIAICVGMVSGYSIFMPFISVDPISDKNAGDSIILTGTTSLPAGTEILVQVYAACYESGCGTTTDPKTGTVSGEFSGATGIVTVVKGTGNVNIWSTPIETKTFKTGEYVVTTDSLKGDISKRDYTKGDISGKTKFTLYQGSASAVQERFIHVDPVSEKKAGDKFPITGTTNLPENTEIQVEVYAASFETEAGRTGSGEFSGAVGIVDVTHGNGDTNIWSMDLDTTTFEPTEYLVNASLFTGDVKKGDFSTGNANGKTTFTVQPASGAAGSIQSQVSGNGKYIRIDPVPETTTGDLLIVGGTTDFPAGTILMVQTGSYGVGYGGDAMVREGTGGVNRFSMPVDTTILKPGSLTITVTQMKGDPAKGDYGPGTVKGTASFTLKGTYRGVETPVQATITKDDYIRINPIGDRSVGDQFLITGTTSLPAGTGLIWEVMPYTGTIPAGLDMNAKGIMANNPVTKGDDTANRISLAVDMSGFAPGKWVALVGVMKGEPNSGSIEIEKLTGSAYFTVK